jgi:prepilin-type N-terminal cleavage/methylation domain-containing protein
VRWIVYYGDSRFSTKGAFMRRADAGSPRSIAMRSHRIRRARSGFTILEVLVVMVMASTVMALAMPKTHGFYSAAVSSSARDRVQSYVGAARAVTVQSGRTSVFHSAHNRIWVTADSAGAQLIYRPTIRLDSEYNVALTAGADSVVFDGRGIAQNLSSSDLISVVRDGVVHTVCVSALGAILKAAACS